MSAPIAGTLAPREVARQTGVSPDTLRHYERKGLLPLPARTPAGYRRYPPEAIERVRLVQRALLIGFSLDELARLLRERARGAPPCRKVRALVAERLAGLDARLEELTTLRDELRVLLADWDRRLARTPDGTPAHLLETLGARHEHQGPRGLGFVAPKTPGAGRSQRTDTSPCLSAARHATGQGAARVRAPRRAWRRE